MAESWCKSRRSHQAIIYWQLMYGNMPKELYSRRDLGWWQMAEYWPQQLEKPWGRVMTHMMCFCGLNCEQWVDNSSGYLYSLTATMRTLSRRISAYGHRDGMHSFKGTSVWIFLLWYRIWLQRCKMCSCMSCISFAVKVINYIFLARL